MYRAHVHMKYSIYLKDLLFPYLDFPAKIPFCLLVPVSGEFFSALFTGAVADNKRPLMRRLAEAHVTLTKSLSPTKKRKYQSTRQAYPRKMNTIYGSHRVN